MQGIQCVSSIRVDVCRCVPGDVGWNAIELVEPVRRRQALRLRTEMPLSEDRRGVTGILEQLTHRVRFGGGGTSGDGAETNARRPHCRLPLRLFPRDRARPALRRLFRAAPARQRRHDQRRGPAQDGEAPLGLGRHLVGGAVPEVRVAPELAVGVPRRCEPWRPLDLPALPRIAGVEADRTPATRTPEDSPRFPLRSRSGRLRSADGCSGSRGRSWSGRTCFSATSRS